jgi:hypothetical protein
MTESRLGILDMLEKTTCFKQKYLNFEAALEDKTILSSYVAQTILEVDLNLSARILMTSDACFSPNKQ